MQLNFTTPLKNKEIIYSIQDRLCIAMSWLVLSLFLANVGLGLEENFGIAQKTISLFLKLITVIVFIWTLWRPVLVSPAFTVLTTIVFCVLTFVSALLQSNNIFFHENIILFFVFAFPITIISFYILDYKSLLSSLRTISLLIGYACFIMLLLFTRGITFFSISYSMGLSYALLLPLLVLIEHNFEEIKISYLIAELSTLATMLIFGSRGAILCVVSYLLFVAVKQKKWKILCQIFIMLLIVSLLSYYYGERMMLYLADNNIQARNLLLFSKMQESGIALSGRDYIYSKVIAGIKEAPFIFKGMYASYMLNYGVYPHNIFLEAGYDLGVFSILLFCAIARAMIKTFCNKSELGKIELILLSYNMGLLVSGSFWREPYFWMWLVFALKNDTKYNQARL